MGKSADEARRVGRVGAAHSSVGVVAGGGVGARSRGPAGVARSGGRERLAVGGRGAGGGASAGRSAGLLEGMAAVRWEGAQWGKDVLGVGGGE